MHAKTKHRNQSCSSTGSSSGGARVKLLSLSCVLINLWPRYVFYDTFTVLDDSFSHRSHHRNYQGLLSEMKRYRNQLRQTLANNADTSHVSFLILILQHLNIQRCSVR